MDARKQLVFFGETLDGFDPDEVKRRLGQLLKLDDAVSHKLFSGERTVIKRSIDEAEALRYAAQFAKLGAHLRVEAVGAPPAPAPSAPAALSVAAPAPALAGEEQITCPNCGERQSKRILCRSCSTDMPMGIAAREETRQAEREARLAERRSKRGLGPPAASDAPSAWGFGFSGRMARLPYATASSWSMVVFAGVVWWVLQNPTTGRAVTFLVLALLWAPMVWRWGILRCHDFNRSGWWTVLTGVPYLGFVVQLVISCLPGTDGENDHGGPPRSGSLPMFAVSLAVMCLSVGLLFSMAPWEKLALLGSQLEADDDADPSEVPEVLTSAAARESFSRDYAQGRSHKAFAWSSGGAWGWKVGAATPRAAVRQALANCEAQRSAYTAACEPIHVNDQPVSLRAQ